LSGHLGCDHPIPQLRQRRPAANLSEHGKVRQCAVGEMSDLRCPHQCGKRRRQARRHDLALPRETPVSVTAGCRYRPRSSSKSSARTLKRWDQKMPLAVVPDASRSRLFANRGQSASARSCNSSKRSPSARPSFWNFSCRSAIEPANPVRPGSTAKGPLSNQPERSSSSSGAKFQRRLRSLGNAHGPAASMRNRTLYPAKRSTRSARSRCGPEIVNRHRKVGHDRRPKVVHT